MRLITLTSAVFSVLSAVPLEARMAEPVLFR
jgi:hypothetical protein